MESAKVILQSKSDDVSKSEKVRIYHHDLHKKSMKRSAILKLQTEHGLLEGHDECANYLEDQVADLLLQPSVLHQAARDILLDEVEHVFTDADNENFAKIPDEKEVKKVLDSSNLLAAPGTDSIPSLLYHECWPIMKIKFTEVIQAIFRGHKPTTSQRTSLMDF